MVMGRKTGPQVFGIGFHKTGTTTLGQALEKFGYSVCHGAASVRDALGNRRMLAALATNELDEIFNIAAGFEAFEDNPWFILYRELDRRFPGGKFILTVRDDESWLRSAVRYYGRSESDLRWWIYGAGSPVGNEALFLERYRRHNAEVRDYFAHRPEALLIVDWEKGDGWNELSAFLQRPAPALSFPHRNSSHDR